MELLGKLNRNTSKTQCKHRTRTFFFNGKEEKHVRPPETREVHSTACPASPPMSNGDLTFNWSRTSERQCRPSSSSDTMRQLLSLVRLCHCQSIGQPQRFHRQSMSQSNPSALRCSDCSPSERPQQPPARLVSHVAARPI